MDSYKIDKCKKCDKIKALKNGICIDCNKSDKTKDFFKDIFGFSFKNEEER